MNMEGGEAAELIPVRLRGIRAAERAFDDARTTLTQARGEHGELATAYRIMMQREERGLDPLDEYNVDEREGAAAADIIEEADAAYVAAATVLRHEISRAIGENRLNEGDEILSPHSATRLRVGMITIMVPEPELSEVTMTADGQPIVHQQHSWPLSPDQRPIVDDSEPVRYERWSREGLRVAGTVHVTTRQLLSTE